MAEFRPVVEVNELVVEYGSGTKKNRAVDGISFEVNEGETVGFIGANGAGKSTTIKTMMGFLFPHSGSVRIFGKEAGSVESRQRVGYLPEVALYYPFMKGRELLELYGGLHGLSKKQLRERIPGLLEKVGLSGRGESLLKSYSKGMQQRIGIAQAIIAEPDLLIFDELSSGLDPVGRHDLRSVLLELKQRGCTIFFSSHELTEVEALCDRVIMIHKGKIVASNPVEELMKPLSIFEIVYRPQEDKTLPREIEEMNPEDIGGSFRLEIRDSEKFAQCVTALNNYGAEIVSTKTQSKSLEDFFIELIRES